MTTTKWKKFTINMFFNIYESPGLQTHHKEKSHKHCVYRTSQHLIFYQNI